LYNGKRFLWASLMILLLGAGLRILFIHAHGLEPDETFSIALIQRNFAFLFSNFVNLNIDVEPLLFHIPMHFWTMLAGISMTALRYPNVMVDLLVGAVLLRTARTQFGITPMLICGVLWAVNPLEIWGVLFVRMYAMLTLFTVSMWVCMFNMFTGSRRYRSGWWIGFVVSALGVSYTHALGMFVVGTAMLFASLWAIFRHRWEVVIAVGIVGLFDLPYVVQLLHQQGASRRLGMDIPDTPLSLIIQTFSVILTDVQLVSTPVGWILALGGILVLGLSWRSGERRWLIGLSFFIVSSIAAFAYLALRQNIFDPRYMGYLAPFFLLTLSVGIAQIPWRALRGFVFLIVVSAGLMGLTYQWRPASIDDFVTAAEFLNAHADSDDLILVISNYAQPTLQFHYHGSTPVIGPWHSLEPATSLDDLPSLLAGHDTVWVAYSGQNIADPTGRLDGWLRDRYPIRTEIFPRSITVRGYDLNPETSALPSDAARIDGVYKDRIAVRGFQTYVHQVSAWDDRMHPPSGWIHVALYFEALQPGAAFEPRLTMEDDVSQMWGLNLVRGTETYLRYPPSGWQPGQIWRSDLDINLNPATPAGQYHIVLRLFDPGQNEAWVISQGEGRGSADLILAPITVTQEMHPLWMFVPDWFVRQ
jgi:hypothetical protein